MSFGYKGSGIFQEVFGEAYRQVVDERIRVRDLKDPEREFNKALMGEISRVSGIPVNRMSADSDYFAKKLDDYAKSRNREWVSSSDFDLYLNQECNQHVENTVKQIDGVRGTDGIIRDKVTGVEVESPDYVPPFSVKGTF